MKVYCVLMRQKYEGEGDTLVAVCATEELAQKIAEERQRTPPFWTDTEYVVEDWEVKTE